LIARSRHDEHTPRQRLAIKIHRVTRPAGLAGGPAVALWSKGAATRALQKKAPGEKLTSVATVAVTGLKSLHSNTAELLVFVDQSSTRVSDKQKSTSAAQLDVTAVKHGSTWKIAELRPL
jgi:hypothetical protein